MHTDGGIQKTKDLLKFFLLIFGLIKKTEIQTSISLRYKIGSTNLN